MKYKSVKIVEQELELAFPCYVKFGDSYTKILNETECIRVQNWQYGVVGIEIERLSGYDPFRNDGWKFISEEEFNSVYQEVFEKLVSFQPNLQPA